MAEPEKPHMTMDQVMAIVSQIAQDPEAGADRFRALKFIAGQEQSSTWLPDPLSPKEKLQRLSRVMRGAGRRLCQDAWRLAWPTSHALIDDPPSMSRVGLTSSDKRILAKVRGLKSMYRHFPEIKGPGFPTGFPAHQGKYQQMLWCQAQAMKLLKARRIRHGAAPATDGGPTEEATTQAPEVQQRST